MSSNCQWLTKDNAVQIHAAIVWEYVAHSGFDVDLFAEASAATTSSAES
jgi:hypothetical protein